MTLLDVVLFLPLVGFLVLLLVPKDKPEMSRALALALGIVCFVASLGLILKVWWPDTAGFQFENNIPWITTPAINYHVGLDGLSLWLVVLTTLLTPICVLISWRYIDKRIKEFYAFLILLEFGLIGVFISLDLFLFYVFWELALVPMYFLIGIWGYDRRIYAAVKFFIYTMAGSVLMLAAMIYVYNRAGTFDYPTILSMIQQGRLPFNSTEQTAAVPGVLLRLRDQGAAVPRCTHGCRIAHVEAPTAGSVMLASVMLKMGYLRT